MAGARILGKEGSQAPTGEPAELTVDRLNAEQQEAVRSGVDRDTAFVWGPPGTGKMLTIGALAAVLHGEAQCCRSRTRTPRSTRHCSD